MKQAVWKFKVKPGEFTVDMPRNSLVLTVQVQRGTPQMWVLCRPDNVTETRRFYALGTGFHTSRIEGWRYVGTFQFEDDGLVFHLFEEPEVIKALLGGH